MQQDNIGINEQAELDRAFFVLNGVCWQAFESEKGLWFLRIVDVHDLTKYMWVKLRICKERKITEEDICFDFLHTNMNETLKYKYLYDTERNHNHLASFFLGKHSKRKAERKFYEENIHCFYELGEGISLPSTH